MEQIKLNQVVMKEEIDDVKGKVDQILEAMLAFTSKEDNPQVVADARNIASQFGSSSLWIPEVEDSEFGHP